MTSKFAILARQLNQEEHTDSESDHDSNNESDYDSNDDETKGESVFTVKSNDESIFTVKSDDRWKVSISNKNRINSNKQFKFIRQVEINLAAETKCIAIKCTGDHMHSWKIPNTSYIYGPYICSKCSHYYLQKISRDYKVKLCLSCWKASKEVYLN